jgi:hypothetical protein
MKGMKSSVTKNTIVPSLVLNLGLDFRSKPLGDASIRGLRTVKFLFSHGRIIDRGCAVLGCIQGNIVNRGASQGTR